MRDGLWQLRKGKGGESEVWNTCSSEKDSEM